MSTTQRVTDDTSIWEVLVLLSRAGHTSLTLDSTAADYNLHEKYDIGLHSRISIIPHGDEDAPRLGRL